MGAIFPSIVYCLCFLACALCAVLLGRMFLRTSTRMLFWSACCFTLLAIANLLVVLDMLVLPAVELRSVRLWLSLSAVTMLLYGFIWDME